MMNHVKKTHSPVTQNIANISLGRVRMNHPFKAGKMPHTARRLKVMRNQMKPIRNLKRAKRTPFNTTGNMPRRETCGVFHLGKERIRRSI